MLSHVYCRNTPAGSGPKAVSFPHVGIRLALTQTARLFCALSTVCNALPLSSQPICAHLLFGFPKLISVQIPLLISHHRSALHLALCLLLSIRVPGYQAFPGNTELRVPSVLGLALGSCPYLWLQADGNCKSQLRSD